ncbi:hypothetical protein FGADI_12894 [Fusarium gaditjirri]|uniref:Uncharacterized protein n=1 Tax=Fusarium gaditjirri TaxID=282569 RepID=A0A8H4SR14_9HYPO|nr:hypothetical protein FGADI_12894 [Fusarium gaditjirri]
MLTEEPSEGSNVDIVSPRQTPKEWLQKLTTVDYADPSAVINLRLALVINNVAEFDLVTDDEGSFSVSPFPGALTVEDTKPKKDTVFTSYVPSDHPGLLCLEFASQSGILAVFHHGETIKPSAAGLSLPSLVLPIGQLRHRYKTKSGASYSVDTDYVIVVDAVAAAHPVWVIFDRNAGNLLEERGYINPETVKVVFSGTEKNFDAAQVLPSIHDWTQSYGTLSLSQIRDAFQKTGITGEVRARNVTSGDIPAAWNKFSSFDENN